METRLPGQRQEKGWQLRKLKEVPLPEPSVQIKPHLENLEITATPSPQPGNAEVSESSAVSESSP